MVQSNKCRWQMWEKWGEEIIGQGCQESLYQELTLEPRTEKR